MLKVVVGSVIIGASIVGAAAITTYYSSYQTCVRAVVLRNPVVLPKRPGDDPEIHEMIESAAERATQTDAQLQCARR